MGLFNHFPYPDTHQLNLDWILDTVKSCIDKVTELWTYVSEHDGKIQQAVTDAQTSAQSAQTSATGAQEAANTAQTSAQSAQTSATGAQEAANTAQTSAQSAQASATSAQEAANTAQTSAQSAQASATSAQESATELANLLYNNAGAHNAFYRGKSLGSTVTTAQYAAIQAGTFEDLYIGDYWTIGSTNYRIAAFDYYLNNGNTTHHVVIVPDTCLYNAQMHNTSSGGSESGADTTAGGYVGSDMYKSNLERAKTIIKSAFSDHVLKHRIYLTNAVANGRASGGEWYDSEVDLMCEQMVYGSGIFSPVSDGSTIPDNYRIEKSQLPLFQHEPSRICNNSDWWLRDVINDSLFASVYNNGGAKYLNATYSAGVRPAFCIS